MLILGINSGWHDGSAALVRDGALVHLLETDRVSRVKQGMYKETFLAVQALLEEAHLTMDDVDVVAIGWEEVELAKIINYEFSLAEYVEKILPKARFPRSKDPEFVFVPHHVAHAASGMFTSGFSDAAVLVVDGRGECQSTSIFAGSSSRLDLLREWPISESLGNFYGQAADWTGFTFWGPGKLMGLAPYGVAGPNTFIRIDADGYGFIGANPEPRPVASQEWDAILLNKAWFGTQFPYTTGHVGDVMAHAGFAATVQNSFEEAMFRLAEIAKEATGSANIVIAGGAGQNCTFNGRLFRSGLFDDVYVPPITHDTGVGLGAALHVYRQRTPSSTGPRLEHAYYGHTASEADTEAAVARAGFPVRRLPDPELLPYVASRLAKGAIVGWFDGTAEIGQRALGARSMLADPRDRASLRRMNEVKGREIWRPLAPSVLEEHADEFFDGPKPHLSQFMLAALPVRPEARARIPATVHVDGSARPQFVRKSTNPRYWQLIEEFRVATGVPVVMNTSFNLASEPIVHTPEDAVRSFAKSDMDMLVLGGYLLEKPIR